MGHIRKTGEKGSGHLGGATMCRWRGGSGQVQETHSFPADPYGSHHSDTSIRACGYKSRAQIPGGEITGKAAPNSSPQLGQRGEPKPSTTNILGLAMSKAETGHVFRATPRV